jgi:hypothetical protein
MIIFLLGTHYEGTALRHRINGIQYEVGKGTMQQFAVGSDGGKMFVKLESTGDVSLMARLELRLKQPSRRLYNLIQLQHLKLWVRHSRELAEARNNIF